MTEEQIKEKLSDIPLENYFFIRGYHLIHFWLSRPETREILIRMIIHRDSEEADVEASYLRSIGTRTYSSEEEMIETAQREGWVGWDPTYRVC
jgi:hypothetical protein